MFPERLPQSWSVVSYGARAFAYDWWRTFEDEAVTISADAIATSVGVHPKSRRYVREWLDELIGSGAVERCGDGLRMVNIVRRTNTPNQRPTDAEPTPNQRPTDAEPTPNQRPTDAEPTPNQRPNQDNTAEPLSADASRALQTYRETEIQTEVRARPSFDAQRMRVLFTREYEAVKGTVPGMGGKNLGEFPATVLRTAQLQCAEPEELFVAALSRWLRKPHDEVAQRAPYACFASAWSELTADQRKPSPADLRPRLIASDV